MIDLENKIERDKLIDDYFNKGYACDIREVYQAVVNTIADLEYANDEKVKEIEQLKNKRRQGGTYECFHCLHDSVVWQCDYDFSDYGYEGDGIVQVLHCSNCGADIEYYIPIAKEDIDELKGEEECFTKENT